MTPTCYHDLNQLLTDLTTSVRLRVGDNSVAVYLQGPFAVGDADEDSDVDFMVTIVESLSQVDVTSLTAIHASLYECGGYGRSVSKGPTRLPPPTSLRTEPTAVALPG
jgi:predicted nucleotidyltransferase